MNIKRRVRNILIAGSLALIVAIVVTTRAIVTRRIRKRDIDAYIDAVTVRSTNAEVGIGEPGDEIVLLIRVSREIDAPPEVLIGGIPADRVERIEPMVWEASRRLGSDETDGAVEFLVQVGESTLSESTDGSAVTVQESEPDTITSVDIEEPLASDITSDGNRITIRVEGSDEVAAPGAEPVALPGDTIVLDMEVIDKPDTVPEVWVARAQATVESTASDTASFRAHRVLDSRDPDGTIEFLVRYSVNGEIRELESTTDGSRVAFANGRLIIKSLTVSRDDRANQGVIRFRVSDELGEPPVVRMGDVPADTIHTLGDLEYEARSSIDERFPDGRLRFTVAVLDMNGDRASVANTTSDGSYLVLDRRPPRLVSVTIRSVGEKSGSASAGDTVAVEFEADETLSTLPEVVIAGDPAETVLRLDDLRYRATRRIGPDDSVGPIGFRIVFEDLSGNPGVPVYSSTDQTSVVVTETPVDGTAVAEVSDIEPGDADAPVDGDAPEVEADGEGDVGMEADINTELDVEPTTVDPEGVRLYLSVAIQKSEPPEFVAVDDPEDETPVITEPDDVAADIVESVETIETVEVVEEPVDTIEVEVVIATTDDTPIEEPPAEEPPIEDDTPGSADYVVGEDIEGIQFLYPENETYFGPQITVVGGIEAPETVESLSYIVSPLRFVGQQSEILTGNLEPDEDGRFELSFATETLDGDQQVRIEAVFADGKEIAESLSILDGGDKLPSFAALSDDASVALHWDPMYFVASYTAEYTRVSGAGDAPIRVENLRDPIRIDSLTNGERYEISLTGYDRDGEIVAQSIKSEIIPLSERTLEPSVEARYGSILVAWDDIPGTDQYSLFRAETDSESFELLKNLDSETEFRDADISPGRLYRYSVKPTNIDTELSRQAQIISLTQPENKAGTIAEISTGTIFDSVEYGSYLLTASGMDGFGVFDVSTPASPVSVASIELTNAQGVAISGAFAYVADSDGGLRVIDLDEPTVPRLVGSRRTSDAQSVAIWAADLEMVYAVVADGSFGVKVIDASIPNDPVRIGTISTTLATDVAILTSGSSATIYVADGPGGLKVFDGRAGSLRLVSTLEFENAVGALVARDLLIATDRNSGVSIYSLDDPLAPSLRSKTDIPRATDIALRGEFLYVTTEDGTVEIVNLASITLPVRYESVDVPAPLSVTPTTESIFVGTDNAVHVLKNYNRGASYEVSSVTTPGNAYGVTVHESVDQRRFVGVADHRGGVHIIDVTVPSALSNQSIVETIETEHARDIVITGALAYVADGPAGLRTIDLSGAWDEDPETHSEIVNSWDTDGNARGLALTDGRIYLADGNRGLKVFDLEEPTRPVQIESIQTEYAVDLTIYDDNLFLADGDGGTGVYRIDQDRPVLIAQLDTGNTRSVATDGNILGVAGSLGIYVYDISDVTAPNLVGTPTTRDTPRHFRYRMSTPLSPKAFGACRYSISRIQLRSMLFRSLRIPSHSMLW